MAAGSDPRLPELFAEIGELDPARRAARLDELRGENEALAAEIESLLAVVTSAERRFASPAFERTPGGAQEAPALPETVGPYRLLREIGRGGMGRVFLAEQQSESFRRTVALKIVERHGALHPDADAVRRFRDEVRILAGLDHPGIGRFFDGGRAPDGTWFLALEYVEGEDLTAYVKRHALDLRARLELFLQVVDAVDFAHRQFVVHRDLKPANVIVGNQGRTKLLDFGISKILDPAGGEEAAPSDAPALTPAYASPEQLRGERTTVASDVFSLGIMLYEILAGRRPFARREVGPDSTDARPDPPSTAARVRGLESTTSPSGSTRTDPRKGWRDLTGDLDAITLKALAFEPGERYATAAELGDDLRRHLSDQPVRARPDSAAYRARKFASRHRLALAAAGAVLLALIGGLSVALVQRSRAVADRARAEASVADLHRLTQSMLFDIYEKVRRLPGSLEVSDAIVESATRVLERLSATAGDDPRLLADLAAGYDRLGLLLGTNPAIGRSLQRPHAALEFLQKAAAIRDRLAARPESSFGTRLAAAREYGALSVALRRAGEAKRSEEIAEEGIRRLTALAPEAPDRAYLDYRLAVAHGQARMWALSATGSAPPSDPHFAAAAKLWREFVRAPPAAALAESTFPSENWLSVIILVDAGFPEEALALSNLGLAAIDRRESSGGPPDIFDQDRPNLLVHRAGVLQVLHRPQEALADFKELLRLRAAIPIDPDDLLSESIRRLSETQRAAEVAALVGDVEFALRAIAIADGLLDQAERQFGAGSFAPARIEFGRARGDVLVRQAGISASPSERGRLLLSALDTYRAAIALGESLGGAGHIHGLPVERFEELRQVADDLARKLHR